MVHLWRADLALSERALESLRAALCGEERRRAQRFRFDRHRRRFAAARGILRDVLSRYLDAAAGELVFAYGQHGKPSLAHPAGTGLRFNLSHTGTVALIAVSRGRELGVDIERVNPHTECMRLAERFFSPGEAAVLGRLPGAQRPAAFFEGWTRKEAYIKAIGSGLALPLRSFSVGLGPYEAARLLDVESDAQECQRWGMADVDAGDGVKAAVVAAGRGWSLRRWQWVPGP